MTPPHTHIYTQTQTHTHTHLVNVPQPLGDVVERFGVGDVVDEHDAHRPAVVGGSDGVEPLLSRRVPVEREMERVRDEEREGGMKGWREGSTRW